MPHNEYHFTTDWCFQGTVKEVADILSDGPSLTRWWPAVYLDVQEIEQGEPSGVGRVVQLHTRGWLPYTLRWQFRVAAIHADGFDIEAWGDFVGQGQWRFRQDGDDAHIRYDWKIRADKPLLRNLSWLLKPIFRANHHWAMAKGEQSLRLELARRRASVSERSNLPPPPNAPSKLAVGIVGLAVFIVGVVVVLKRAKDRNR